MILQKINFSLSKLILFYPKTESEKVNKYIPVNSTYDKKNQFYTFFIIDE